MKKAHVLFLAVIALLITLPAFAQECSIQTITGVYVYRGAGQSFMGAAPLPFTTPPDVAHGILPLHAPGTYLNGSQLGVLTVHPDYTVDTLTWLAMGRYRFDPAGESGTATVTSVGWQHSPDGQVLGCIATIEFTHPILGPGREKFVVFDNGNEIRGVHALNGNPVTGGMFVGKRIARTLDTAPRCGPQTLKGSYVASCERGLVYNSNGTTLAINSMLDLRLGNGTLAGVAYTRIENQAYETPLNGTFTANADCTGAGSLDGLLPGAPGKALFVLLAYDQGKGAFLLPTELELPNGARVAYPTTQSCILERTGQ